MTLRGIAAAAVARVAALAAPAAPAQPATERDRDRERETGSLAVEGDPDPGACLAAECVTCHSPQGENTGVPAIALRPEDAFVAAMQAYKRARHPHAAMQMVAGRLDDADIAALAAQFGALAPDRTE